MKRTGEYARRGDYHVNPERNWPYLPVYLEKMKMARAFLDGCSNRDVIYDMGCGEGVLVDEYRNAGYSITGMDLNYSSDSVMKRSFLNSGLADDSVDVLLCLDVIEHLVFVEQEQALKEFVRVLKPGGRALITVPNLAHLASRISFLFAGRLTRTSSVDRHPGDRPAVEYVHMLQKYFFIRRRKGVFPTFPILSILTVLAPARFIWLHNIYNRFLAFPNLSFLNVFYLEKKHD